MNSTARVRVMVVDDHPAFRRAACDLLEHRGYAVVCEAGDAPSTIEAVDRLTPEAMMIDVCLGADNGFDLCRTLTRSRPELSVLLVSNSHHAECDSRLRAVG